MEKNIAQEGAADRVNSFRPETNKNQINKIFK